jgi:hypothetical protein
MDVSGQLHDPAALPPWETVPGTHWIGGLVGPRTVLDAVVKSNSESRLESNPRTQIIIIIIVVVVVVVVIIIIIIIIIISRVLYTN